MSQSNSDSLHVKNFGPGQEVNFQSCTLSLIVSLTTLRPSFTLSSMSNGIVDIDPNRTKDGPGDEREETPQAMPRLTDSDPTRLVARQRQMALRVLASSDPSTQDTKGTPAEGKKSVIDPNEGLAESRPMGVYIPPARLKALMAQRALEVRKDGSEEAIRKEREHLQRVEWDALRKNLNGLINKVCPFQPFNPSTLHPFTPPSFSILPFLFLCLVLFCFVGGADWGRSMCRISSIFPRIYWNIIYSEEEACSVARS